MNSKQLLQQTLENAAAAQHIASTLTLQASAQNGLPITQVQPAVQRLNDHLRSASAAAQALQNMAAGNPPPKRGD